MKKRLFPPEGARINLGLCVVLALFLLSAVALLPRMGAERASRNAGYNPRLPGRGLPWVFHRPDPGGGLGGHGPEGATGLMVSELTGTQLSLGVLPSITALLRGCPTGRGRSWQHRFRLRPSFSRRRSPPDGRPCPTWRPVFRHAYGGSRRRNSGLSSRTLEELLLTGVLPDMDGLLLSEKLRIPYSTG